MWPPRCRDADVQRSASPSGSGRRPRALKTKFAIVVGSISYLPIKRSALGWYRPSVGVPRDVGCRRCIRVANLFSVQFL